MGELAVAIQNGNNLYPSNLKKGIKLWINYFLKKKKEWQQKYW